MSSVDSRPLAAKLPSSEFVASVCGQAPCCGVSISGQIHATLSGVAEPVPVQYGRKVRLVPW